MFREHTTLENFSSGILISWGIALLNPYNDYFNKNYDLFLPMSQLGTQDQWGIILLFVGLMTLLAAYSEIKNFVPLIHTIVFTALTVLFLLGNPFSQLCMTYSILVIFNFLRWREVRWTTG